MRKLALWLVFLLAFAVAPPLLADEMAEAEEEAAEAVGAAEEGMDAAEGEMESAEEEMDAAEEEAEVAEEEADEDWDDFDFGDEEEESGFAAWGSATGNRYLIGVNSMATFLADPVMSAAEPDSEFDELPGATVTKYPVGFVQGTLLGTFRACAGLLDVLLAPLTPFRMLSPEPRYLLFENAEHEEF